MIQMGGGFLDVIGFIKMGIINPCQAYGIILAPQNNRFVHQETDIHGLERGKHFDEVMISHNRIDIALYRWPQACECLESGIR